MTIATSYGEIRPWRDSDLAALVKHADNRKVWLNLTDAFPHPYTTESGRAFLDLVGRQDPTTYFALATSAEAIGGIGISINRDVRRLTAEMGYWLAEPYWGKGFMTETVTKFTEQALKEFGLLRIYAEPYSYNAASCRLLEKAGFVLEGRMRSSVIKDGKILDQFLYAKIRETARSSSPLQVGL
jgi:RimJ/RimL family protein N-acetyltransferase